MGGFCLSYLILFAGIAVRASDANISLGSCSLSCSENQNHGVTRNWTAIRGAPGKRGAAGPKGEQGDKGDMGRKGEPASPCSCASFGGMEAKIAAMETELTALRARARMAPTGWTRGTNNLFYKYIDHEKVTYETARWKCAAFGARLASTGLRTPRERREIIELIPDAIRSTYYHIWIGLDDLAKQGTYVWSDGVISTRMNTDWGPQEPNRPGERCAGLHRNYNGRLIDHLCDDKSYYLCEI